MTELPKILRERMQQQADQHPDADMLTAFAENSLLAPEREQVLAHLAVCTSCRDVLALSAGAAEESRAQGAASPVRTSWLRWPALRWAAVASAATVVIAAVLLGIQGDKLRSRMAAPAAEQAKSAEPAAPPRSGDELTRATGQSKKSEEVDRAANQDARRQASTSKAVASNAATADRDRLAPSVNQGPPQKGPAIATHGPAGLQQPQLESAQAASAPAANAAPVPANEVAQSKPQARAEDKLSAAESQSARADLGLKDRPAASASPETSGSAGKPAEPKSTVVGGAISEAPAKAKKEAPVESGAATAVMGRTAAMKTFAATARWSISKSGDLLRSPDGANWQVVKIGSGFRAVAVIGNEIWAGGSQGMLYHSVDGGQHWMRVIPRSAGGELSDAVVGIEFTDRQQGAIVTAGGETWVTRDGGQSWTRSAK